ncbi:VOC family protein [Aestuariimicrobium soli]|uniref:VOC family protein n=1 Tax=Aestuariimicrobium soli TaxID=2035834 RepID=UPI003EBCC6ED
MSETKQPDPTLYVLFPGIAREAMEFYHGLFGGDLVLYTYAEFSRTDGPGDAIAHGLLSGPVTLFGSDAGADEDAFAMTGGMLALLGSSDPATLHRWFDALADGGRVLDPLAKKPWGASDGQVVDRYGLRWLIGYED